MKRDVMHLTHDDSYNLDINIGTEAGAPLGIDQPFG
jgi:hypothetical protein